MATRLRLPAFGKALPWGLAALSLVLAFAQRHGRTYTDTRFELTTEPGLFLHRVTSVWSPTVDLGHVQSGQFIGYLFPMGPYFAGSDALGVPAWIAERVWLAAILWLAAWGTVLLVDSLYDRRRSSVHLVAGVLYLGNPYVVVQGNRASGALLAYAALPWVMLAAHRGLRAPRSWRWPAVAALAFAASSGGTNAALVFWITVAPAALLLYEVLVLRARRNDAVAFAWRAVLLTALASAWWVIPVLIQGKQGASFLESTEQPRTIWSTTSMSESLRLMGYWLSYFSSGFDQVQATSTAVRSYLKNDLVIVATFAVPIMAFGGLLLTRRWRYAPFFGLLAVGALLVMAAGYPEGKPAAGTLESVYYHVQSVQFLRTTYKAGPLVALSLACLTGAFVHEVMTRARRHPRHRALTWTVGAAFAGVATLFAFPLVSARLIEPSFVYGSVPASWRSAVADTASATPGNRRIMILPGQLFGSYRWGDTLDTTLARTLTRHPVLQRTVGRYADPRAVDLQETVDDLVQQGRLVPGQFGPLLKLMGVGEVLVAADGRPEQTGETPPATIADSLRDQAGFERPASVYGALRSYTPLRGQGGPSIQLPDLRRYATPEGLAPKNVRLAAVDGNILLDGDAEGIAQLAANGALSADRALFYAGDLDRRAIRDRVRRGAELVFSDSNRRRRLTPSVIRGDAGPTLAAAEGIPRDASAPNLFPKRGTGGQTVADYGGLKTLRAAAAGRNSLAPDSRPFAAFDGRLETTWFPPEPLPRCACLDLELRHPRPVAYIRVHPNAGDTASALPLGVTVNHGPERVVRLSPLGWNRVAIGARSLRAVRLRIVNRPLLGAYGLDEIEVPGVPVREALRLPTWLAAASRNLDLARNSITVELQRTTNDFPFRPSEVDDEASAETSLTRLVTLPARRRFEIRGWASPSPSVPDSDFDRLAGMPAGWRLEGSSRFEGVPAHRASGAFDGDRATAWIADYNARHRAWFSIRAPRALGIRRLRLVRGPAEYAFPGRVDVDVDGRTFRHLSVQPDGGVMFPRTVRTRSLRVEVTDVDAPGPAGARRQLAAVAVAEVVIPDVRPPSPRRHGSFETRCGALQVRSRLSSATARVFGRVEALDRGTALRVAGCGPGRFVDLPAGSALLTTAGSTMRPYLLSLRSPGTSASPPSPPGVVVSQGHGGDNARTGVRMRLRNPAWLILGEGYAPGWRASCRPAGGKDRELGAPQTIDGFANGWRVPGSCTSARFWFAPQRLATASYVVSAFAGLAILLILVLSAVRSGRARPAAEEGSDAVPGYGAVQDSVLRLPPQAAVAIGVGVGLLGGWFFAIRVGVLLALATAFLTWRGVNGRSLLWLAIPPLAVIPLLYVFAPGTGDGGSFVFASERQAAHWLADAAVCAIGAACLLDARSRRRSTADQPPAR